LITPHIPLPAHIADTDQYGELTQIFGGKAFKPRTSGSVKNAFLPTPPAFGTPEFRGDLLHHKTRSTVLLCGVVFEILHLAVLIQYGLMMDCLTDGQMDGHMMTAYQIGTGIYHASIILHSKNAVNINKAQKKIMLDTFTGLTVSYKYLHQTQAVYPDVTAGRAMSSTTVIKQYRVILRYIYKNSIATKQLYAKSYLKHDSMTQSKAHCRVAAGRNVILSTA